MKSKLNPAQILKFFLIIIGILLILNVIAISVDILLPAVSLRIINIFNFDGERNIPTLYSSLTLILSSALLTRIALEHRRNHDSNFLWFMLAAIFAFLAIDETVSLHELLTEYIRETFNLSGLLYYAWVVPYMAGLGVFILIYLKFLMKLPTRTRFLFVLSGSIFVTGAIVLEMFAGVQYASHGKLTLLSRALYTLEELGEMSGIALFIYALLDYAKDTFHGFEIILE